MPHNPRHKKRYGNLAPRTSSSPFANRLPALSLTKNLRAQMEKELLKRKLARFQRAEMRSRGVPQPAPVPAAYPVDHGQGDFPGMGAEMNERGMAARQWVRPDDKRKALHQENIARDLRKREAEQALMRTQPPTEGLVSSLSPGSASQLGVQEVIQDLIQKRAGQLRQNLVPGPDDQAPNVSRPRPESWMTGRLGLEDPTWTSRAPGADAQQAANMAQARRRKLNLAAPGLEGQVFDDDRPTGGEIQAGVQGLLGQYPENVSGAVPDYGYIDRRKHTLQQRQREKDFAKSQRDQATAFEQMEPTQPSFTQRSIAKIFGLPMAGTAAIINPLLKLLGAPDDVIGGDAPMMEDWILQRLQTTSPIAVNKIKDQLAKVYPAVVKADKAVGGVVDDTVKFWGEQLGDAAEAVGVDKVTQIPGQLVEDATEFWGDQIGDAATAVPKILSDTEEYWKPKTQQIGREFDRRWALRQEGKDAIARGPDDPGLLTADDRQVDVGGLLRLAEEGDVTSVPPSERPQKGLGFPGPQAGASDASKDYVPPTATTKEDQKKAVSGGAGSSSGSTVAGVSETQLDSATRAGLERVWGKHTYNPAQRRKQYMSQLKNIYQKAAWLDAIAAISGGKSRSSSYIERAVGMMDAMQKFDQEERVYNIWRDVYYDKDGNYDPPKSKKEAAERARRLGANPEETKSIYGWAEEGEDLQQWWRPDGKGGYETKYTQGKKSRPAAGSGAAWEMGSEPSQMHATDKAPKLIWAVPPGGGAAQYVDDRVVASQQGWTRPTKEGGRALERAIAKAEEHLAAGNEAAARSELKLFFTGDPMNVIVFGKNIDKTIDEQIANIREARGISDGAAKEQQQQAAGPATLEEAVSMAIAHPSNAGKSPQEVRFDVEVWWQKNRGGG